MKFHLISSLRLRIPCTHDLSTHIPLPKHIIYFEELEEDLRRIFSSLWSRKEIMNSPHLLIPLINIRNKKMESWTHTVSLILA